MGNLRCTTAEQMLMRRNRQTKPFGLAEKKNKDRIGTSSKGQQERDRGLDLEDGDEDGAEDEDEDEDKGVGNEHEDRDEQKLTDFPDNAAPKAVVSAPKSTCAPIAMFNASPLIFARPPLDGKKYRAPQLKCGHDARHRVGSRICGYTFLLGFELLLLRRRDRRLEPFTHRLLSFEL